MIAFFALAALALFWVLVIALVKRDRGWVGISEHKRVIIRFQAAMWRLIFVWSDALLPTIKRTTKQMVKWNEAFQRTQDD